MSTRKTIASGILAVIGWAVLGVVVGSAVGYVVYVKQPAVFESRGSVQIARSEPISDSTTASDETVTGEGDAAFLQSLPLLTRAVQAGKLNQLRELPASAGRQRTAEQIAEAIQLSGDLHVQRTGEGEFGSTYEIRFQGPTPTASEKVVQAVIEAAGRWMVETDTSEDWREAMTLLSETRTEVNQRIAQLQSDLQERGANASEERVAEVEGTTVSPSAEEHRLLRERAYQLQQQRVALDEKLRRSESLIQQGAPAAMILASLNVPLPSAVTPTTEPARPTQASSDPDAERKQKLAERLQLEREIEKKVQPLQRELDQLLKKLGSKHPTVVYQQAQIDKLREPLKALPPLSTMLGGSNDRNSESDPEEETVPKELMPATSEQSEDKSSIDPALARKLVASLKALRSEKKTADEQFEQVREQLQESADTVAAQEQRLAERARLETQLQQQQEVLQQTNVRLEQLASTPPFASVRLMVLQAPSPAVQVAPDLQFHLLRGAIIGGCIGVTVILLLLLTSMAARE